MANKNQYPPDYNPPLRGVCKVCKVETKGTTKKWLDLCPEHWQALVKRNG